MLISEDLFTRNVKGCVNVDEGLNGDTKALSYGQHVRPLLLTQIFEYVKFELRGLFAVRCGWYGRVSGEMV